METSGQGHSRQYSYGWEVFPFMEAGLTQMKNVLKKYLCSLCPFQFKVRLFVPFASFLILLSLV